MTRTIPLEVLDEIDNELLTERSRFRSQGHEAWVRHLRAEAIGTMVRDFGVSHERAVEDLDAFLASSATSDEDALGSLVFEQRFLLRTATATPLGEETAS